ncbi:hypothetical protein [Sphingomonas faeni]|uniref:hypothetical protein n=1 Tax=Sphingomonas faeni TaxID=185950 RepID=UPI0033591538
MAIPFTRFNIADRIVGDNGRPSVPFHRWINDTVSTIISFVNDQAATVAMILEALRLAGIAVQTANEAKEAALAATAAAADAAAGAAAVGVVVNSYVVETGVLSSAIDPADPTHATITVANHTRQYGDTTRVAVTGSTIAGLAQSTQYYLSYLDPDHTGGVVAYEVTTNPSEAGQSGDRHLVGGYATPSSSGSGGGGGTTRPPGIPSWKFPDNVNIE